MSKKNVQQDEISKNYDDDVESDDESDDDVESDDNDVDSDESNSPFTLFYG